MTTKWVEVRDDACQMSQDLTITYLLFLVFSNEFQHSLFLLKLLPQVALLDREIATPSAIYLGTCLLTKHNKRNKHSRIWKNK